MALIGVIAGVLPSGRSEDPENEEKYEVGVGELVY
jgi:hypothetical protein